jgi:hypothetical protein
VRLTTVVMFGAGYVMGTKAGRERYEQIVTVAEKTSKRLEQFSARKQADARSVDGSGHRDSGRHEATF